MQIDVPVFELPGGWGVQPPTAFSTPLTPCQIMHRGVSYILLYLGFTSQFWLGSDHRKVQPLANFSQFKHCGVPMSIYVCVRLRLTWRQSKLRRRKYRARRCRQSASVEVPPCGRLGLRPSSFHTASSHRRIPTS